MNLVAWHTARKMRERATLPDLDTLNHKALKALIVAQHAQILSKDEQLLQRDEQLASREEEIERLKLLIAKLRRMQFGRKSEKLDRQIEQLESAGRTGSEPSREGSFNFRYSDGFAGYESNSETWAAATAGASAT